MNPFSMLAIANSANKEESLKAAVSTAAKNKDKIEKQIAELQQKLTKAKHTLSEATRSFNEWQVENNKPAPAPVDAAATVTVVVETCNETETEDARIARIVAETLANMGVTTPASKTVEITVEKSADDLTLAPAPVAGASSSKGGNYPAPKQNKQRR